MCVCGVCGLCGECWVVVFVCVGFLCMCVGFACVLCECLWCVLVCGMVW